MGGSNNGISFLVLGSSLLHWGYMPLQASLWLCPRIHFELHVRFPWPSLCRDFLSTQVCKIYLPVNFLSAQRAGTYTASVNMNDSWFPISPLYSPILAASTPT